MIKGAVFRHFQNARARVCVWGGGGEGGSLPHETGRKASQCILHADPKNRGFKLINSFVFCSS